MLRMACGDAGSGGFGTAPTIQRGRDDTAGEPGTLAAGVEPGKLRVL